MRAARFHAEDAEFGQEETEELSAGLTTYPKQEIGSCVGPDDREPRWVRGALRSKFLRVRRRGRQPTGEIVQSEAEFVAMCGIVRLKRA